MSVAIIENAHFDVFEQSSRSVKGDDWGNAKAPNAFGDLIAHDVSSVAHSRKDLFDMAADKNMPIDVLCLSILAWGGIRKNNIEYAFALKEHWLPIAAQIPAGDFNRSQAYNAFAQLRELKQLKGMGPAYFTKLIYFLMPDHEDKPRGYIMDQWVGCSVNILAEKNLVRMDASYKWSKQGECATSFTVSDVNTPDDYEAYCKYIEALSKRIGRPPNETEFCLMSEGGKTKKPWREYVIKNRRVFV